MGMALMTRRDPYRRAMRRSRRTGRNRDDAYPILIIGTGEPVAAIAAAMIVRWAYRHRSAFLPFLITGAAFATAAFTHPHHARWWITTACVTVLATVLLGIPHRLLWARPASRFTSGLLARLWAACGIDRPAERAYGTVVIASAGGWLDRRYRVRPVRAAIAADRRNRDRDPGHSMVGAPPAPLPRQDRAHNTGMAVTRRIDRAARVTDSLGGRGCVGMDRPRHSRQRRHRRRRCGENTRD